MDCSPRLRALGLFDAKVPRYTSYPTAPQFSAGVGVSHFDHWVKEIPPLVEISLYLHVPFCRRLCWFCACRTQGTQKLDPVQIYLETLKTEIRQLASILPAGVRIGHMHWGGGTPTLLTPQMMTDLAGTVRAAIPMSETAEFSVEIDPNEIDQPRVDALAAARMTRASIGVQDFDPEIQKTIGRIQSYEVTQQAAQMLRAAGVTSLNTDILFGLPHQTTARMATSVKQLLTLEPDRVALYGYAHVPWMARRQALIPSDALPTPQERLTLFETAQKLFLQNDYAAIGIDHFARPSDSLTQAQKSGTLRRNFQGYTSDPYPVLIGLGASAISKFPQGYAQNDPSTGGYTKSIRAGHFATTRGHTLSQDDKLRARIIEALMCDFKVDISDLTGRGLGQPNDIHPLFERAAKTFAEFVDHSDQGFFIHPKGRALTRMIARQFDAYDMADSRHSSAI